ncbi:hypothetical protein INT47_001877 [Mucor saturninus]|uniref:Uncharacterized protein n=1 Tax=Mucor saturninus TaxID=64648 RepID=A0A8H7RE39_9FUNG|nr:hypothetical protein INT47_001877 [Mucor saturninus]
MRLSKLFGSVRLVQEVTRSNDTNRSTDAEDPSSLEKRNDKPIMLQTIEIPTLNLYCYQPTQKFTVRHYNKPITNEEKSKSQKLLCLWPLPTVTRYMILIATLMSVLNWLGVLSIACSAPSFIIHRLDFKNMCLAPFLFDWTLQGMMLYGWNLLILGLFEESLTLMLGGGTRRFIHCLFFVFVSLSTIRVTLGFIFSKSTGWAFPSLFFSNSMHECSQGLAPFLFALLVVQSLCIGDKYILIYGQGEHHQITVAKVTLQFIMCLVNYTTQTILWWSLSGLFTGFITTLVMQAWLAFEKREVKDQTEFMTLEHYRRTPLWRLLWSATKRSGWVVLLTLPVLLAWNTYYTRASVVSGHELNTISHDRYLFTFVFMTAPRRGDPAYLTRTIESYLENWPENPSVDSPYARMQAIIYTHFTNHTQFEEAKEHFSGTVKGQRYLKWVHQQGETLNQRLHVSKALDYVTETFGSTYYALMEDDFPVCGQREWHEIETVIYKAEKTVPNHCGVFVGTGGSGLFLKPEMARLTSQLLLHYVDMPPDIIIQKCLMGQLPQCAACKDSLVTSKTLLMYHIGYNTSTSDDRTYKKDEFQCGWRHPFNGDPSVITL